MTTSKQEISTLVTSDKLHNKNCFNYLKNLKIPDFVLQSFPELAPLKGIINGSEDYNPRFAYGDLYKLFFDTIDKKEVIDGLYPTEYKESLNAEINLAEARLEIQKAIINPSPITQKYIKHLNDNELPLLKSKRDEVNKLEDELDDFFISIYANDNKILEETYEAIKDITLKHNPSSQIESLIAKHTKDQGEIINQKTLTPTQAEGTVARIGAVFSDTYKPQHTTSLSTERHYNWNKNKAVKEWRFGTQAQREEGREQATPLFEQLLKIQKKRAENLKTDQVITHLYVNNLGRDRTDFEGNKEKALTHQLEQLEQKHPNIAVITLPADKGLLNHHAYKNTRPNAAYQYDSVHEEFLQIASQDPNCTVPIKDFYISQRVRELLFKDAEGRYSIEAEKAKLSELIDKSFAALGIKPGTILSPSQKQAVYFHFIKSELTSYIINTLKPKIPDIELSFNISCKDAIDRGGVSSAYYNLMESFKPDSIPMSREEFERALHAAPTMVKGRGMNNHLKILWNTIDLYVKNNYESLKNNSEQSWLIEWRDMNCPKERVNDLLIERLPQLKAELDKASYNNDKNGSIKNGLKILDKVGDQINKGVSGKRLLLEAAVLTPAVILNSSDDNIKRYENLSKQLEQSPALKVIGGLIKFLAGAIVYAVTKGKKHELLEGGLATLKSGMEVATRRDLQSKMKEQLRNSRDSSKVDQNQEEVDNSKVSNHH